ncbi:transmembrane channel-like protein 3 [Trichonephila clavipes]|nr:transmembrane channel-like protein 3 [Trichonephila clavipes]
MHVMPLGVSIMVWGVFFVALFEIFGACTNLPLYNSVRRVAGRSPSFVYAVLSSARSPDLNHIEHLWDVREQGVKGYQTSPTNHTELWTALANIWQVIPVKRFQKLVEYMPRRVTAVIKARENGHGSRAVMFVDRESTLFRSNHGFSSCPLCRVVVPNPSDADRDTAVSIEEEETPEEVKENMRLNKQIIETIKLQPWRMKKKYKILRKAKTYVRKHEGELAQSKRSKDVFAKYTLLWSRISLLEMNRIRKTPGGLDSPIVLSDEFLAINDDNVNTAPIMAVKTHFGSRSKFKKNIIDVDVDNENEMNNEVPVPK